MEEKRSKCLIQGCCRWLDLRKLCWAARGDSLPFLSSCCLRCGRTPSPLFHCPGSLGGTRCRPEGSCWAVFNDPTRSWHCPGPLSSATHFLKLLQSPQDVLPPTMPSYPCVDLGLCSSPCSPGPEVLFFSSRKGRGKPIKTHCGFQRRSSLRSTSGCSSPEVLPSGLWCGGHPPNPSRPGGPRW